MPESRTPNTVVDSMYTNPLFFEMFNRAKVMYMIDYCRMRVIFRSENKEAPLTDEEKTKLQDWWHRNVHGGSLKFE